MTSRSMQAPAKKAIESRGMAVAASRRPAPAAAVVSLDYKHISGRAVVGLVRGRLTGLGLAYRWAGGCWRGADPHGWRWRRWRNSHSVGVKCT